MAVKRILDIDIKNKGLFSAIYGNIADGEFFVDSDLKKYNLWQQIFIYLKSMLYGNVIFYDTTNNFHSYSKSDLIRFLNLETRTTNQVSKKYQSRHIRSALGNRRFKKKTNQATKPRDNIRINSSIQLITDFGNKHSFYRTKETLELENYLKTNLTNKRIKTALIIKNPENSTFQEIENYITLFETLDNNYTIDDSQNKVIIVFSNNTTSNSFIESFNNNNQLFLNDFFKNLFLRDIGENRYEIIKKNVTQIMYSEKNEIRNLINLKRLNNSDADIFKQISLVKLAELLELEQFENKKLYKNDLYTLVNTYLNVEDGLSKLNKLIGLKVVKKTIKSFIKRAKYNKEKNTGRNPRYHLMFTGNPGTGKTIVAEIVAKIFKENQVIKGSKFTEIKASDLISEYRGQTAKNTKKICEKAYGGVLFIDEAYALASDIELGKQSMGELIQYMENDRDKLVVIFAGYEKDMEALFELNEGLKRRIGKKIHFPDYTSSELIEILELKMKPLPFKLENESIPLIQNWIEQRIAEDPKGFGNAGGVDKLVDNLIDIAALDDKEIITEKDLTPILGIAERIDSNEKLNELIGLGEVKKTIKSFIKRAKYNKEKNTGRNPRYHLMFTGNPGTGKTVVAEIVAKIFKENQIIKGSKFTEVKASDLISEYRGQTAKNTKKICEKSYGGVLFIDEAYALASDIELGKQSMGELIQYMENDRDKLVVIFAGYEKDMEALFELNEGLKRRIGKKIHFPDYTSSELIEILELKMKPLPFKLENESIPLIQNWIEQRIAEDPKGFGNAGGVDKLVDKLIDIAALDDKGIITKKDLTPILGIAERIDSNEKLNELIGLGEVKKTIKSFIKRAKYNKEKNTGRNPRYHLIFTGNPGTGKTVVAEIVAKIFKENQIIKGSKFTEVKASDLISEYRGQTAKNTKKICEKSYGGVLFIDEAYALASDIELGKQSMGELIQYMENDRDKLVVIFAGYEKDMEALFELNEGLKRRIGKKIHFPDYTSSELIEILDLKMKGLPFKLDNESVPLLQNWIEQRIAEDPKGFGNAGGVDKLVDKLIDIAAHDDKEIITKKDLTPILGIAKRIYSNEKLNELIGLEEVKISINKFIKRTKFYKVQGVEDNERYHLIFTGNPGTGKTIVAKLIANIYKENQIIKGEKYTEVKASELLSKYVNESAEKTRKICEKARGGVLFIDEAYALCSSKKTGEQSMAELIQFMENDRDKLAIIFAGYKEDMQELIDINQGLKSRIGETIHFPDYSVNELIEILKLKIKNQPIILHENTISFLKKWIEKRVAENSKGFGNGRGIDNLKTKLMDIRIEKGEKLINIEDLEIHLE